MEWISAGVIMGCGVLLAMPGATFQNSMAYRAFELIAPENIWAAFCVSVGLLRMAALWINGSWRRSPLLRGATSVLGVGFWVLCISLILHVSLPGPAMTLSLFLGFLAIDLICAWRSGRDHVESERAYGRDI